MVSSCNSYLKAGNSLQNDKHVEKEFIVYILIGILAFLIYLKNIFTLAFSKTKMKLSFSSVFLALLGATSTLASPISKQAMSPEQSFGILSIHSGNANVHLHEFYVGQSGHVYLSQYDNAEGYGKFSLKDSQLLHNNETASLDKDGALVFQSSGSPLSGFDANKVISIGYELQLNGTSPVACPVASDKQVYQVYYGNGNGSSDCVGIDTVALNA
ncbi:hypothetical protein SPOG_01847 [Schizosaccharomyces cryophilus OY26]|uniref:But2 family protein n=1 Tax=Schizosaccharomyces cryophilus (strain OY26 / ATCC MYA-4695 / CBS 11777 / NBRC 106824 / NRRL Y48691) TaxID=653667 RepID=S9XFW5_SCHCR|nr:uncharacterized protein SPOG_01847 [Schizosaccharomyces cryophilus OY26]EPY52526.1 hypothetical protein SPOG_01847 [Schizosaccharomyces cryophilus OY26]